MPIFLQHPVQTISEKDFHKLDYEILRLAFNTHNDLGRFYDENIYQNELERRCRVAGIATTKEFEIKLIHQDFEKPLFVDLLANESSVYELKAAKSIVDPHRIQALNYLFATDTQHGKLINFRSKSVEHEFVSTQLNADKRNAFKTFDDNWNRTEKSERLRILTIELLKDWGAFLDTDIYFDALCHFLGGKDSVVRKRTIKSANMELGTQSVPHLTDTDLFCLTSVTQNVSAHKQHLGRFLKHTDAQSIHWINFNHSTINFTSLNRKSFCP